MCQKIIEFAGRWRALDESFSENIIAIAEGDGVSVYYTSRDQYSHAAGFSGAVACLEILGEFIFSGELELKSLAEGTVSYAWLYDVLRAVAPPEAVSLIKDYAAVAA